MKAGLSLFLRYRLPAILWALLIFVASSIPATKLPKFIVFGHDKLIHLAVFFIFGVFVYRSLEPRAKPPVLDWRRVAWAVGLVVSYGIIDELHQGLVPGRTVDVVDACADAAGGLLSAAAVYLLYRLKNKGIGGSA